MSILTCSLDLTCHLISGKITFEDLVERVMAFYDTNPTTNVLWDLRDASFEDITTENAVNLAEIVEKYSEKRQGGKTGIVAPRDLEYGLSRAFEMTGDLFPFEIQVFRNISGAIKWLSKAKESLKKT